MVRGTAFPRHGYPEVLRIPPDLEDRYAMGSDFDVMGRTLIGQYAAAASEENARYTRATYEAWHAFLARTDHRISNATYQSAMKHWYQTAVREGYIDPTDRVWIKQHVLYHGKGDE